MRSLVLSSLAAAALLAAGLAQAQTARSLTTVPSQNSSKSVNTTQATTFGLPRPAGLTPQFPAGLTAGSGPAAVADPAVANAVSGSGTATTSGATTTNATNPLLRGTVTSTAGIGTGSATTTAGGTDASDASAALNPGIGSTAAFTANLGTGAVLASQVMGAGAGTNLPNAPQTVPFGSGLFTPVDAAAAFLTADANSDRELSRGEASRLNLPFSFEEMDRNHDGRLTRFEFDDALR